ncbi:hypothetical protein ABTX81_00360 [Kitasatospora sp. NPDC097605]|uniref:hypothetical protein n=1 Tax=Kitasatospora sp. NPDC097605 TaxID=3157226 RepID=UPI003323CB7A
MTRTTAPGRGARWRVPSRSTLVTTACLPFVLPPRGFAEMMTDPCHDPGCCPQTHTGRLLLAAPAPGAALPALVVVLFGVRAGT